MKHIGRYFLNRKLIVCISIAGVVLAGAPLFAQQKGIAIAPNAVNAAASVKALSIIKKPGSDFLNTNLNVTKAGADAVLVTVPNVTIDLQGFSIVGSAGTAVGIDASGQSNVVVRNGTIMGMGGAAVIAGSSARISGITATANASAGTPGAVLRAGDGSSIIDNLVNGGIDGGLSCGASPASGCLARGNVLQGTSGAGLTFGDSTSGYSGNVIQGFSPAISGGASLGNNLCNGAVC